MLVAPGTITLYYPYTGLEHINPKLSILTLFSESIFVFLDKKSQLQKSQR